LISSNLLFLPQNEPRSNPVGKAGEENSAGLCAVLLLFPTADDDDDGGADDDNDVDDDNDDDDDDDDLPLFLLSTFLLICVLPSYIFCSAVLGVLRGFLKAIDHHVFSIVAFTGPTIISIPVSYALGLHLNWGVAGIWFGMFLGIVVAMAACIGMTILTMSALSTGLQTVHVR